MTQEIEPRAHLNETPELPDGTLVMKPSVPGGDLWGRLEGETPKPWEAFQLYRDMGLARSQQKVADSLGKSRQLISRWSGMWHWVERCKRYDAHMDDVRQKENAQATIDMRERHAAIATAMTNRVVQRLASMSASDITPGMLPKYAEVAIKLERLARGATTENVGVVAGAEEFADLEGVDLAAQVRSLIAGALAAQKDGEDG